MTKKIIFKTHALFYSILLTVVSNNLLAETYTHEYTYKALDEDDKLSSRVIANDQIRVSLLKKIGSHIQQIIKITETGSANSYAKKDVEAITANLTKVNIVSENYDGENYYIKAEIDVDTQPVLVALEDYKNDISENSSQLL